MPWAKEHEPWQHHQTWLSLSLCDSVIPQRLVHVQVSDPGVFPILYILHGRSTEMPIALSWWNCLEAEQSVHPEFEGGMQVSVRLKLFEIFGEYYIIVHQIYNIHIIYSISYQIYIIDKIWYIFGNSISQLGWVCFFLGKKLTKWQGPESGGEWNHIQLDSGH